jgi:hypothetical protein
VRTNACDVDRRGSDLRKTARTGSICDSVLDGRKLAVVVRFLREVTVFGLRPAPVFWMQSS